MDLNVLMSRYRGVYHDFVSWDATLADMLADVYDRDTVEGLASELRERGRFRQPVALGSYEEWDYSGAVDEERLVGTYDAVLDGTHRVCAHLLTGMRDVFVVDEDEDPSDVHFVGGFTGDEPDPLYSLLVTTYLDVPLPFGDVAPARVFEGQDDEREVDLDLWEALISLRVDDDVWITSPTSGSSRENEDVLHYSITWDAEAFRVHPSVITERIREKLSRFGYAADRFDIRTVVEDMSGDVPVVVDPLVALPHLA